MRRLLRVLLVCLALAPCSAWAAIGIDSEMPSNAGQNTTGTNVTNLTYSFTNTAGTLLICAGSNSDTAITLTATYNAVSMTQIATVKTQNNTLAPLYLWYLKTPATGANNVVVTNNTSSTGVIISGCLSLTGTDGTTPVVQSTTASDPNALQTTATSTLSGTVSGNQVVDVCLAGANLTTDSHTLTWVDNTGIGGTGTGGQARSSRFGSSGGSVTMSHTIASADHWACISAEFASAAGAAASPRLLLLGVGP